MDYEIKLDIFKGPLDLLLHLIESNEIDIYNIPIALITEKYLEYIHTLQLLNLEGVGEFIVMAATLMQIKAKMLLPQLANNEDGEFLIEEDDPRWELAQKLIEYKRIKEATELLKQCEAKQAQIYLRSSGDFADLKIGAPGDPLKDLSLADLMKAFQAVLESQEKPELDAVPKQVVSLQQRMAEIMELVTQEKHLFFCKVFSMLQTKIDLITCFLAILELIKLKKILAYQDSIFGEIMLTLIEEEVTVV